MNPRSRVLHRLLVRVVLILVACFAAAFSPQLFSQTTDATLSGTILDPSSRVVPDAEVIVTNVDTAVNYSTKTNQSGIYVLPDLPPGRYRVTVSKLGFKQISLTNVELHVQDTVSRNFNLDLGASSETITVDGSGIVINTTDATVSTTIDRDFAENLPLNGRSFQTLLLLSPGTLLTPVDHSAAGNGGTFSVNGERANANAFSVDGVSANLGTMSYVPYNSGQISGANPNFTQFGTTQGMLSVDALQEFKIQTSSFAPEFGRQPGGQVSLLTRSGTNDFHGTAFDYLRNTVFDANNWFNDAATPQIPKGVDHQNDFGGTLGGPVDIPNLYNGKDKTFFFFSYEGLRLLLPFTTTTTVPTPAVRQEAAPAFQSIVNSFPLPTGNDELLNYAGSSPTNLDSYGIRIDHTVGSRLHLFGRYSYQISNTSNFLSDSNVNGIAQNTSRSITAGADISIRPDLQNELRVNYSTAEGALSFQPLSFEGGKPFDSSILLPAPYESSSTFAQWIYIYPDGNSFYAENNSWMKSSQRQVNVVDGLSYSLGAHQLKWGVDYRRLSPIYGQVPYSLQYDVSTPQQLQEGVSGDNYIGSNLVARPIYTNFSAYAQDTWKVFNRLTLTYGLRWELNPAPGEVNGIQPLNVIGLSNPATATLAPPNTPLYKTTYGNFAPRLGIAYQIRQKPGMETVLRLGLGTFYDLNSETTAIGYSQYPFQNQTVIQNVQFPLSAGALPVIPPNTPLSTPYPGGIYSIDPNLQMPFSLQWNFSLEQALGTNQSITMGYVASAGYRLLRSDELFNFNPNFGNIYVLRNSASSNYQSLQVQYRRRLSAGFQVLASYTYSHSIDNASAAEFNDSAASVSASGTSFANPNVDRGDSDFDLRNAFRAAATYNIPTWKANFLSKAILGGWSVDAIGMAQSGLPENLIGGFYELGGGLGFADLRPNVVPGQPFYIYGAQCAEVNGGPCPGGMGFNPAAFTKVPKNPDGSPTQVQGTLGRNVLRGFGTWQMDFALHRQFSLTERVNLQFRSEFFNLFNHPNFGPLEDRLCGPGCFGLANATLNNTLGGLNSLYQVGGPRSLQLALKLVF
jgi:hypothetical protein